jgi:hypothetical protein
LTLICPGTHILTVLSIAHTRTCTATTGSQGSDSEADGCFGKLQAQSIDVVKRMQTQPGANKPMGFVNNPANHIKIVVFMALFAPGLRLEHRTFKNFTPSPLLLGLLNNVTVQETFTIRRSYLYIIIPRVAYLLAANPKVIGVEAKERGGAVYHFLKTDLLPTLSSADKDQALRVRSALRPILHRAFNLFTVWHWLPRPEKTISFSFLISYLWHYQDSKATTNMFCQFAEAFAADNSLITARIEKIRTAAATEVQKQQVKSALGTKGGKPPPARNLFAVQGRAAPSEKMSVEDIRKDESARIAEVMSGEHARAVIGFLTTASRLREELTMNSATFSRSEKQYQMCLKMLTDHLTSALIEEPVVQQRFGTIHRRRIESFLKHIGSVSPKKADDDAMARNLTTLEAMYAAAEGYYSSAIDSTYKSWAYPLVGMAQCSVAVYRVVTSLTKSATFGDLVQAFRAIPGKETFPRLSDVISDLGMRRSKAFLQEADIASTYIKKDEDQERTRNLVVGVTKALYELQGSTSLADDVAIGVVKAQDQYWRSGAECFQRLVAVAETLVPTVGCINLDTAFPGWMADVYRIQKLSMCAHVPGELTMRDEVQQLLEVYIVRLVKMWRDTVERGKAHGLAARRTSVMLAVYYTLHPDEAAEHGYSDLIPRISAALSGVGFASPWRIL